MTPTQCCLQNLASKPKPQAQFHPERPMSASVQSRMGAVAWEP